MLVLIQVRIFSKFVVKCGLINDRNSTVITLETWIVHVLCRLQIKYYIVKVFFLNVTFQLNSKTSHFWTYLYECFSWLVRE